MSYLEPETTRSDWRAYWRFIFDVIDGVPRVQQEITLWPISGLTRLAYSMKELEFRLVGARDIRQDHIEFRGGHLEFDVNLNVDITNLVAEAGLATGPLEGLSESIDGENIFIRADIALGGDGSISEYPIFYYPQFDPVGVRLIEVYDPAANSRNVKWSISNQRYLTQTQFSLEDYDRRHGLRVQQDLLDSDNFFEFHADTIPLEKRFTAPNHLFPVDFRTIHIGWTPGNQDGLWGAVYHLTFDPNSSCPGCPKPTFESVDDWQSE